MVQLVAAAAFKHHPSYFKFIEKVEFQTYFSEMHSQFTKFVLEPDITCLELLRDAGLSLFDSSLLEGVFDPLNHRIAATDSVAALD